MKIHIPKPIDILNIINQLFETDLRNQTHERHFADLKKIYYYFSYKYCIISDQEDIASLIKRTRSNIPRLLDKLDGLLSCDERLRCQFNLIKSEIEKQIDLSYLNDFYHEIEDKKVMTLKRSNALLSIELNKKKNMLKRRDDKILNLKTKLEKAKNNISPLVN